MIAKAHFVLFEIHWIEKSDEFMVKEFMVKKYGFLVWFYQGWKSRIEMCSNLQYGNVIVRINKIVGRMFDDLLYKYLLPFTTTYFGESTNNKVLGC